MALQSHGKFSIKKALVPETGMFASWQELVRPTISSEHSLKADSFQPFPRVCEPGPPSLPLTAASREYGVQR